MTNQENMQRLSREELAMVLCDMVLEIWGCERCPYKEDCSETHNGAYIWLGKEAEDETN